MDLRQAGRMCRTPLYNQNRTEVIDHLTVDEYNSMIAEGRIRAFKTLTGKFAAHLLLSPQQAPKYRSNGQPSPTVLTMTDMLLNAETAERDERRRIVRRFGRNAYGAIDPMIVGNAVDRAKSKVEAWSEVHDTRAVVISAGRVCQPQAISA